MEIILLKICKLLKDNAVTNLEWDRMKYFIDMQYKEEKSKTTLNVSEDSLENQIKNTSFYSIGSTD